MDRFIKNSPVVFFIMALIFLLSFILPVQSIAATPTVKQNWKATVDGKPLFKPFVQSDSSLVYGTPKVVKNVYQTEIMSISTEGKTSKKWTIKSGSVALGGTEKNPQIIVFNTSKGTITAYSPKGKKSWTYKAKLSGGFEYQVDQNGDIYITNSDKILKISSEGKKVYQKTGEIGYLTPNGEVYIVKGNNSKISERAVTKLSTSGETLFNVKPFTDDTSSDFDLSLVGVANNHIYFSTEYYSENYDEDSTYKLYVLDDTGKVVNSITTSGNINKVVENNGSTIAADNKNLYILDSNGSNVNKATLPVAKDSYGEPDYLYFLQATSDGNLYGWGDYNFYKFNSTSGTLDWKVNSKDGFNDVLLNNGKVYVSSYGNKYVYIYDGNGQKVGQISVGAKIGEDTILTADSNNNTVFVLNSYVDSKKRTKTTVINVKQ